MQAKKKKEKPGLVGVIVAKQFVEGVDNQELAKATGIPYSTLCMRFQKPGTFRLSELQAICGVFHLDLQCTDKV